MPLNWKKTSFLVGKKGPAIKLVLEYVTIASKVMRRLLYDTNKDIVGRLRHDDC
jgi:hypothetical protein